MGNEKKGFLDGLFRDKWLEIRLFLFASAIAYLVIIPICELGLIFVNKTDWHPQVLGNDWQGLVAFLFNRIGAIAGLVPPLFGAILFFDWLTPGDWLKEIENGNIAAAITTVGALVVIGVLILRVGP